MCVFNNSVSSYFYVFINNIFVWFVMLDYDFIVMISLL